MVRGTGRPRHPAPSINYLSVAGLGPPPRVGGKPVPDTPFNLFCIFLRVWGLRGSVRTLPEGLCKLRLT